MKKTTLGNIDHKDRSLWFYIAGFLLAGALHLADRLTVSAMLGASAENSAAAGLFSTVLSTLNFAIYFVMIVRWFISLRARLLPSRGRSYLSIAAAMMLLFLFDRILKYRIAESGTLFDRILWYGYYIPLAIIPTMFLLTCLETVVENRRKKAARIVVIAFCILFILVVLTNDMHLLMFRPAGKEPMTSSWQTHAVGPFWFAFYAYILLCMIGGTVLLAVKDARRDSGRRALPSVIILLFTFVMAVVFDRLVQNSPWVFPEAWVFCMLGIFENCIRSRLIPSNDQYDEFFENIRFPAIITDRDLCPVYRTVSGGAIPEDKLSEAMRGQVELENGKVLYCRPLSTGYVFFVSDLSALRALNDELSNVAEALEGENDLLRFENRQKEERARIDARNAVYAKASAEVYEAQKKVALYLDKAESGEDYDRNTARALLLDAYIKRKTNFVLTAAERETFTAEELFLALDESLRFLSLCGVASGAEKEDDESFSYAEVTALYDTFEALIEALADASNSLAVTLRGGCIRMLTDAEAFALPSGTPARVLSETENGQLYLTLTVREGGAV